MSLDLIPDPTRQVPADWVEWLERADAAAAALRIDVVARDAANEPPHREIEDLRSRGLLTLAFPSAVGGAGLPWELAAQVARRIARVDAGVAHVLAYHYAWTRILEILGTPEAHRLLTVSAAEGWLWASPGSARLVGLLRSRLIGDERVINGAVGFATGAPVAQRLFVQTIDEDSGNWVVCTVDPASEGLTIGTEWDVLGQRLSASPSVVFDNVRIPASEAVISFGLVSEPASPFQSISVLNFQHLFGVLLLGIAEGALEEASAFTRSTSAPWYHAAVDTIGEEPYILGTYGEYLAKVQSVSALVERGGEQLRWLVDHRYEVTAEQRGQVAETIASGKAVAIAVALEVTAGIFDLTGARATTTATGLDRHWRNARTLSLHDPLAYKHNELGRFYLNGELPRPSGYR